MEEKVGIQWQLQWQLVAKLSRTRATPPIIHPQASMFKETKDLSAQARLAHGAAYPFLLPFFSFFLSLHQKLPHPHAPTAM